MKVIKNIGKILGSIIYPIICLPIIIILALCEFIYTIINLTYHMIILPWEPQEQNTIDSQD